MRARRALAAAACALAACAPPAAPPAAPPPQPTGPAPSAEARARALLQRQIDAAMRHDHDALVATFAADAIVLTPGARPPESASFAGLGDTGPDGVTTTRATIARLVAGGTADAVWLYAEVAAERAAPVDGEVVTGRSTTRVVELLAASAGWRAVAGSFTAPREPQPAAANTEIPGATAADGPLARLAAAPGALAAQLAPAAIAVGPARRQLALEGGAGAALAAWRLEPLALYGRAREVRTPTWGFVQAHLDHPAPDQLIERLGVQLFAVPAPGGAWRVVLAQYLAQ